MANQRNTGRQQPKLDAMALHRLQAPVQPTSGFGLLGEALPTVPVVYRDELPRCVGACQSGNYPCRHPLACSVACTDDEFADIQAELMSDHAPFIDADPGPPLPPGYPVWWWIAMTLICVASLWVLVFQHDGPGALLY